MNRRDLMITLVGSLLGLAGSVVGGIAVGKYMLSENQNAQAGQQLRATVANMRRLVDRIEVKIDNLGDVVTQDELDSTLEIYQYRLQTMQKVQATHNGRIQNIAETQRRLCRLHDIVCATRNTLWQPPLRRDGDRPLLAVDRERRHRLVAWSQPD